MSIFQYKSTSCRDGDETSSSWITILGLLERHTTACNCSYCQQFSDKVIGRKAPGRKAWNCWWVLYLITKKHRWYLRYHSVFYKRKLS